MTAVYRYDVPIDENWHDLLLSGAVLHVAVRQSDVVTLWALHTDGPPVRRRFMVFGTGETLAPDVRHVGTALAAGGAEVWHVFERGAGGDQIPAEARITLEGP